MESISVNCNECGAPLDVPQSIRFVTCSYCMSKLEIHRNETSIYTEQIDRIDQNTQKMSSDLDVIRFQNELERLDREWMLERELYLIKDKNGSHVPNKSGSHLMPGIFVAIFGCIWILVTLASRALPLTIFGIVIVLFALSALVRNSNKAAEYQQRYADYQVARRELLDKIT